MPVVPIPCIQYTPEIGSLSDLDIKEDLSQRCPEQSGTALHTKTDYIT